MADVDETQALMTLSTRRDTAEDTVPQVAHEDVPKDGADHEAVREQQKLKEEQDNFCTLVVAPAVSDQDLGQDDPLPFE